MGERIADFCQLRIAALGNFQCAREHVRRALEYLIHLVVAFDVEVAALEFHPVLVLNTLAGLNADHHVLRMGVVLAQVMAVIGGDERHPHILFKLEKIGMDAMLQLQPLVLNLEEEVLFAKNISVGCSHFSRRVVLIFD